MYKIIETRTTGTHSSHELVLAKCAASPAPVAEAACRAPLTVRELPEEMIDSILDYLSIEDLVRAMVADRIFRRSEAKKLVLKKLPNQSITQNCLRLILGLPLSEVDFTGVTVLGAAGASAGYDSAGAAAAVASAGKELLSIDVTVFLRMQGPCSILQKAVLPIKLGNENGKYKQFARAIKEKNPGLSKLVITGDSKISLENAMVAAVVFKTEEITLTFTHCDAIIKELYQQFRDGTCTRDHIKICAPGLLFMSDHDRRSALIYAIAFCKGTAAQLDVIEQLLPVYCNSRKGLTALITLDALNNHTVIYALVTLSKSQRGRAIINQILDIYIRESWMLMPYGEAGLDPLIIALSTCSDSAEGKQIIKKIKKQQAKIWAICTKLGFCRNKY